MKKKVTLNSLAASIEDLAVMVGAGFNEVGTRLGMVQQDITVIKGDIERIDLSLQHNI